MNLIPLEDVKPGTMKKMVALAVSNMIPEMRARSMFGLCYNVQTAISALASDPQIVACHGNNLKAAENRNLVATAAGNFEAGHLNLANHHMLLNKASGEIFEPEVLQAVVVSALKDPAVIAEMGNTREGGR